jgi:predicted secreted protein
MIFCILPFDVKSIDRPKDGSMPGAPVNPGLKRKLILTTAISCVAWVVIDLIILYGGISFRDMAAGMKM